MVFVEFDVKKKHLYRRVIIFSDGYPRMGRIRISRSPEALFFLNYIFLFS